MDVLGRTRSATRERSSHRASPHAGRCTDTILLKCIRKLENVLVGNLVSYILVLHLLFNESH